MAFASRRFGPSDCSPNLYLFGFPKKKNRNSVRNRHNEEHLCSFQSKIINYGSREGTIQKYFANPKKYFKSQYFSQITVEKFDRSKKLLQILRKFIDPQITFSIIRK